MNGIARNLNSRGGSTELWTVPCVLDFHEWPRVTHRKKRVAARASKTPGAYRRSAPRPSIYLRCDWANSNNCTYLTARYGTTRGKASPTPELPWPPLFAP